MQSLLSEFVMTCEAHYVSTYLNCPHNVVVPRGLPVCVGGKQLAIRAAVLPGTGSETPLLLSKELLRGFQVKLDMKIRYGE